MLGVWPGLEIGPALCNQFERQIRPESVNLGDVAAEQSVQGGANIEGRAVGLLLRCPYGRRYFALRALEQMSEKEKADIFKTKADAARALVGTNSGQEIITREALFRCVGKHLH